MSPILHQSNNYDGPASFTLYRQNTDDYDRWASNLDMSRKHDFIRYRVSYIVSYVGRSPLLDRDSDNWPPFPEHRSHLSPITCYPYTPRGHTYLIPVGGMGIELHRLQSSVIIIKQQSGRHGQILRFKGRLQGL